MTMANVEQMKVITHIFVGEHKTVWTGSTELARKSSVDTRVKANESQLRDCKRNELPKAEVVLTSASSSDVYLMSRWVAMRVANGLGLVKASHST